MAELNVLVTVKTYPAVSDKYDELVCTGGICPKRALSVCIRCGLGIFWNISNSGNINGYRWTP